MGDAIREYWPWLTGLVVLLGLMVAIAIHAARRIRKLRFALETKTRELAKREHAERSFRQTEEQLRQSAERLRLHVHQSTLAVIEWDADFHVVRWNPAAERIFGYTAAEAVGQHAAFVVSPDARPAVELVGDRLASGRLNVDSTNENRTKDGRTILCKWYNTPLTTADGRFIGAVSLAEDVTEQKRLEEALRASERRHRLFAENVGEVIWTMDFSGRFRYVSPSVRKLLGYTPEEAVQLTMEQVATPHSAASGRKHLEAFVAAAAAGQRIEGGHLEMELIRKDGSFLWGGVTFSGMYDESGRMIAVQGVLHDVTDRRRIEEELRKAERAARRENAKLTAMISGMEEGVVFADSNNVIVEVNDYLCRFGGKPRGEILGKRIEDFHPGEVLRSILRQIDRFRTNVESGPFILQRRLGGAEVILRMQPIYRDGQYDGVLLNVIDVSGLVEARRQAEAATRAKSEFLANMSHEIRSPLTALLGYADLLRDSSLSLSTRDKYLAVVRRNGEHLLELINDILDLTKIEAGRLALDVQRCSMVSVVADIASTMRARAEQRGIRLTVDYPGDVPETILTDRARLRQALMNLAGNAVKFTEQGEVRIVTTFLPAWRNGTPAVKFEIVDTGIGIREEVLAGLFQPFVQADTTTARRFGGTGLGLAISRHIAELLGGELNATSVWGQGSTFTLIVPTGDLGGVRMLPHPTEVPQEADVAPWQPICENLKGVRILLAEDGFDNQELIGLVLRKAGAEVAIAQNGRVAVEMAQSDSFDLVLMDVNMPEMDGYQATRLLREQGYRKPILALTANAMSGDRERSLEAGCDDHAAKPIDWAHLLHLISVHVGAPVPEGRDAPPPPPEASGDADEVVVSEYESDPLMAKILPGFIERLPGQVDAMRESLACEAYEDLQHLAHKLKGSGGSYGYESLTEASRTLEAAAKARDAGAAAAGLGKLAALCAAIRRGHAASASSIEEIRLRAGDETSERLPVSAGPTPPDWPPPPT